jgi:CheY-like chemotaxis protein
MKRVQITREPMPYGSVLIVDDVETNIYVARGLLAPYGLKIDSAESGYAAIEKIKGGSVFDIIFMDHMMPKMDGIETTKIIRGMGYDRPIVALTANAVSGQVDIFLGNGFSDYISKPIDIRQLNSILNKFIRDKQPPEVIEAARKQSAEKKDQAVVNTGKPALDPHFDEAFLRDAGKSLAVLDAIMDKQGEYSEDDLRTYVIHIHGMKGALANIGKMDLSAIAMKLEQTGRDGSIEIITAETPAFLSSLRDYMKEITPEEKENGDTADDDMPKLREMLAAIKNACEEYNEDAAEAALSELRTQKWSQPVKELLSSISGHLLHSDFDEISAVIDKYLS